MYSIFFTAIALLLSISCQAGTVLIPVPSGPFNVTTTALELVNQHMLDPLIPANGNRRIMVSSFFPASGDHCIPSLFPYMPTATSEFYDQAYASYGLPNGAFESLQLDLCQVSDLRLKHSSSRYPIILFSPGLGDSRLLYSGLAAYLAAQGYAVVTVDHPGDASIVEFPDGSVVFASNISTEQQIEQALEVRVQDIAFLAAQLHDHIVKRQLFPGLESRLSKKMFVAGHSLGGATAASVMANNTNFKAGINLDGTFFGPVLQQGLTEPLMLIAHQGKNLSTDPSWRELWPLLNSTKILAGVNGTVHASFTDLPLLAEALNLTQILPISSVNELVGSIPGERIIGLVGTCVKLFFELVCGKVQSDAFQQGLAEFPEVGILNATFE